MNPAKLVDHCIGVIDTHNALRTTPETQLDIFAIEHRLDENVKTFVGEIFYGYERYTKLVRTLLNGLYARYASSVSRDDYTLYAVFGILAVKKLDELGMAKFRRFVLSQEHHKMHTFLSFCWAPEQLDGWLEDQWSLIYDITFVKDKLIATMKKFKPDMDLLIEELNAHLQPGDFSAEDPSSAREKHFTKPTPFALSVSNTSKKPRPQTPIYKAEYTANPIPEDLRTNKMEQISRAKQERTREVVAETKAKYETGPQPFDLETLKRPARPVVVTVEPEVEYKSMPVPKYPKAKNIKTTTAQVLRDENMYRKKAEEEAHRLKLLEENLRDETEFEAWKAKMLALDDSEAKQIVERRRQEMAEGQERATAAMEANVARNQQLAKEAREEASILLAKRERMLAAEIEVKAKQKEEVQLVAINVRVVQEKLAEDKREAAATAVRDRERRARKLEKEREAELIRRKEVIMQIQAMERLANARAKRPKEFDPSQSSGIGLLDEMSLTELSERLHLLAMREEEERERKRKNIMTEKQSKAQVLEAMVRQHDRMRGEVRQVRKAERKADKRQVAQEEKRVASNLKKAEVAWKAKDDERRAAKREKALQLARELKAKHVKENFEMSSQGGRANAAEEGQKARADKLKADMERGAARQEKQRQKEIGVELERKEMLNAGLHKERALNLRRAQKAVRRRRKDGEIKLERQALDNAKIEGAEATLRRRQASQMKHERELEASIRRNKNMYAVELEDAARAQRQKAASRKTGRNSSRGLSREERTRAALNISRNTTKKLELRKAAGHAGGSPRGSHVVQFDETQVGLAVT